MVRACDRHPQPLESLEQLRRGMAVAVVAADGDQGDGRSDRRQERRVRGRTAVVRHLEQPRTQRAGPVRHHVLLRGELGIPGQQCAATTPRRAQHERGVVELPIRTGEGSSALGRDDGELELADGGGLPGVRFEQRDPACAHVLGERSHRVQSRRQATPPHARDGRDGAEHVRDAIDVVGMGVAHHHQVETVDADPPQPPRRTVIRPAVDQHGRTRSPHQDGVPLADVDRGDGERAVAGSQVRERYDHERRGDRGREGGTAGDSPPPLAQQPDDTGRCRREQDGALESQHGTSAVGDRGDGQDRPPAGCRQREQRRGRGRRCQRNDAARHPDDGRHGGERDGEEVGRYRRHRQFAGGCQQDRSDRHLGAHRDGEQLSWRARQPAQPAGDHRCQQQHPCGRERGQQQSQGSGQQRIGEHEHEHRRSQGVPRVDARPTSASREQEQRHRRRPQHARFEPGQHGEQQQHRGEEAPPSARTHPSQPRQADRPARHQGDVGPTDRRQMRQPGALHPLDVRGIHQPGVARDEPHDQPATGVRDGQRGGPDARAHLIRDPPEPSGARRRAPLVGLQARRGMELA